MLQRGFVCLLFATLAWGQAEQVKPAPKPAAPKKAPATPSDSAKPAPAAEVAPSTAVITIEGVCDTPAAAEAKSAACKTVVTRAQFEKLVNAVAPTAPPTARRQLATRYAQGLVMANAARKQGLDKGPKFEEMMQVMRMQVLAQELVQQLQEKAAKIPDGEIESYYKQNEANFQEADLQRVFIPKSKQLEPPKEKASEEETKKQQDEADEAMKKEAESLHTRAAAGEDLGKLQQEAFTSAGIKADPPNSKLGKVRRSSLPADQGAVMDLKAGEVSQLIASPNGYFIYKVGEKSTVPLDKVREEITNSLRSQRMQDSMQAIQSSANPVLNDKYFGEAAPAGPQGRGHPPAIPKGGVPAADTK